jgi:hypothetical protein
VQRPHSLSGYHGWVGLVRFEGWCLADATEFMRHEIQQIKVCHMLALPRPPKASGPAWPGARAEITCNTVLQ